MVDTSNAGTSNMSVPIRETVDPGPSTSKSLTRESVRAFLVLAVIR